MDARDGRDAPVVDGDTWDAAASSAGDDASDATTEPPDTDEAVALVATALRLRLGAGAASARDAAGQSATDVHDLVWRGRSWGFR